MTFEKMQLKTKHSTGFSDKETVAQNHDEMLNILRSNDQDPYLKRKIKFFVWAFRAMHATNDQSSIEYKHLKQMTTLIARQALEEIELSKAKATLN